MFYAINMALQYIAEVHSTVASVDAGPLDFIKGWMVTLFLVFVGVIGWGYKESQINRAQERALTNLGERIQRLEDKSSERGEVMARMEERQSSIGSDIKEIKEMLKNREV